MAEMKPLEHRGVWPRLFIAHAAIVAALILVFLAIHLSTPPEEGVPIGIGIVGFPLLALGLPWSSPFIIDPYRFDGLSAVGWYVVAFGPAVLNVVLHGVVRTRRKRANPDR